MSWAGIRRRRGGGDEGWVPRFAGALAAALMPAVMVLPGPRSRHARWLASNSVRSKPESRAHTIAPPTSKSGHILSRPLWSTTRTRRRWGNPCSPGSRAMEAGFHNALPRHRATLPEIPVDPRGPPPRAAESSGLCPSDLFPNPSPGVGALVSGTPHGSKRAFRQDARHPQPCDPSTSTVVGYWIEGLTASVMFESGQRTVWRDHSGLATTTLIWQRGPRLPPRVRHRPRTPYESPKTVPTGARRPVELCAHVCALSHSTRVWSFFTPPGARDTPLGYVVSPVMTRRGVDRINTE